MITTVGEAQIIVRANTAAVKDDIAATEVDSDGALAGKAGQAGEDAGAALSSGFGQGAKDIGKDAEKDAEESTGRIKGLYNDLGKKASNSLSSIGVPASLLSGNKIAALGIAAIGAVAIKLGSDMQKADASIATSEGVSVKAATNVGNAFLETGGKVEFSGIKQAQAFAAVAGELKTTEGRALTTADSMTFMKSAMDLASASGQDLSDTTSTLAGVIQAFQLPLSATASTANVLFNASNATGQSLDTLATALEKTRSKLGATSPPMSQLTALIVDMTKAGITGRSALTGVNTAMTGLLGAATGTTKANLLAKSTLEQYGVSAVEANGKITPLSTIIDKLAPKYKTMTEAQQLSTSSIIFGSSAAKQMTAVINAGSASFDKSTAAVTKNNAVTKASAIQQGTLSGQLSVLGAAVSDDGTRLGEVLIPVLTDVAKVLVPVITGFTDVVGWFLKGSTAAHLVEIAIGTVLAPALIKMGVDAVESAGKAALSFVTMGASSKTAATTVAGSDDAIVTANTEAAGSFEEISAAAAADIPGIGASMAAMTTEVEGADDAIIEANEAAGASFTALAGVAAAGIISFVATTKLLDYLKNRATVKQSSFEGSGTLSQNQIVAAFDKAHGIADTGVGGTAGTSAADSGIYKAADAWYKKMEAEKKKKAASAAKGIDAYIPAPDTAAAKAASSAATKAATAAKTAESQLTSALISAIKEPLKQGVDSLKALGVPANRATAVLKDAVKPFTDAVTALEKAGFDASDAVKIADAGQAELTKEAKAAAAVAKAAAKKAVDDTTSSLTALTVNGIQVSGSIYRAAIGAAYKTQTGANLNATLSPVSAVAPISAPVAPTPPKSLSQGIVFQSGAIQIHPSPGNDAASLAATKSYIDQMLRQLASEIRAGTSMTAVIR